MNITENDKKVVEEHKEEINQIVSLWINAVEKIEGLRNKTIFNNAVLESFLKGE